MDKKQWQVRGYEWGLNRPITPLTDDDHVQQTFAEMLEPDKPWRDTIYRVLTNQYAPGSYPAFLAFKRGVTDALPLFVDDGANFSVAQIASAIDRHRSYINAEIQAGNLKAMQDGKKLYVAPEDFEAWYLAKQWRREQA